MKSPWIIIAAVIPCTAAIIASAYLFCNDHELSASLFAVLALMTLPRWR